MEIIDQYCWEEHKKVITQNKHNIPGLKNLAHWNMSKAMPPVPMHHHSNIVEIHCLTKGKRFFQIEDQSFTVTGNELILTFPFENHSYEAYHLSPCSFYGFQIDLKQDEKLLGFNSEYSLSLAKILTAPEHRHLRFLPSDHQLLKLAFENISDGDEDALKLGVQYLSCFLFKIPEFIPVTQKGKSNLDINIKRVLTYIDKEYCGTLHLSELAALSGYSLSRFKSRFKDEVGITPASYIISKKLEYAKVLLRESDLSVTQIALDAGFSSSNYFCSVMKKLSNYTPNQYRLCSREQAGKEESSF